MYFGEYIRIFLQDQLGFRSGKLSDQHGGPIESKIEESISKKRKFCGGSPSTSFSKNDLKKYVENILFKDVKNKKISKYF